MEDLELNAAEMPENEENEKFVPQKDTYTVADIRFRDGGKAYFFDPAPFTLNAGDKVIVDTARGPEFGTCVVGNHEIKGTEIVSALRGVIRLATEQDCKNASQNRDKEAKAYEICLEKIKELGLDMQLITAEYSFDGSKLLFFFTADGRVDFRELVKVLASIFRTRIELRQIGVRDKAKMVGGLGICGRPFCCREFLPDFQPVSIKMAKTQDLSLNPTKISGTCGRLMCCLKYEQDVYEKLIANAPKAESLVDTPEGRGTITEVQLLKESVKVRMDRDPDTVCSFRNEDICVLRNGKGKKGDLPIPDDYAPISSDPSRKRREKPAEEFETLAPVVMHSDTVTVSGFEDTDIAEAEEENVSAAEDEPAERTPGKGKHNNRRDRRRKAAGKPANPSEPAAEAADKAEVSNTVKKAEGQKKQGSYTKHKGGQGPKSQPAKAEGAPAEQQAAAAETPAGEAPASSAAKKSHHRYYRGKKPQKKTSAQ